jgi:adenylosuccinate lyase
MTSFGYDTFLSSFTWRHGSPAMRGVWSEEHKRRLWRWVWLALAEAEADAGLVTERQLTDLRAHVDKIDIPRALAIEADIRHDLMAELRVFAAQCSVAGPVIHLGATSLDIEDNADILRQREALDLLTGKLGGVLRELAALIDRWADVPTMGLTHLQPAEPTTVGHRLALYGWDLLVDLEDLRALRGGLLGKGMRGAVGSSASFVELLGGPEQEAAADALDRNVMTRLGLTPVPVASQTYPRAQDWRLLTGLGALAASLYKFAFDLRLLQSAGWGEWREPAAQHQVSSSAMPFKRNPVHAETIDSLGRLVAALVRPAWDNAAHALFERTLDDAAARNEIVPVAFLALDEALERALVIVRGLELDDAAIAANVAAHELFAATERVLMAAVKAGGDRQALHEILRQRCVEAWTAVRGGRPNPLGALLAREPAIASLLPSDRLRTLLEAHRYVGLAPQRARHVSTLIRRALSPADGPART